MPGLERNGASFGISTNRAQYDALNQQTRSFGKMGFPMASGPVGKTQPLAGGKQAAGMLQRPGPTMPRSGGMVGDSPVFKARPPAGGVTGTLPGGKMPGMGGGGMIGDIGGKQTKPLPMPTVPSGNTFGSGGKKTTPAISNPFIPRSGGPLGSGMKGGKTSGRLGSLRKS